MTLRALLFDTFGTVVDGTVVDWRSGLIADLSAFGERHGVQADWVALADDDVVADLKDLADWLSCPDL